MIFRQLFDSVSGTYTYLVASRRGGEALIIDPVIEKVDRYLQLVAELDLRLVKAVDTHLHADHITGLGALRDRTRCVTVMGEHEPWSTSCSMRVSEGDALRIEGLSARRALYARAYRRFLQRPHGRPGLYRRHAAHPRHGAHRFPERRPARSNTTPLFGKLLKLPDETLVYPAHDYKGDTVTTIGEEKAFNPRLQVQSVDHYVEVMNSLHLPNPKMMDVAVPANMRVGFAQQEISRRGLAVAACDVRRAGRPTALLSSICAKHPSGPSTAPSRARCTRPIRSCRSTLERTVSCTSLRPQAAGASCSTAPSASAPPWRYRPHRTPGSGRSATSKAASTPLSAPGVRSCPNAREAGCYVQRSASSLQPACLIDDRDR